MNRARLSGSSWDHPRGHAPMVMTAGEYERLTGISITWQPRSLAAFGLATVEELAHRFDLMVVDHPHVGVMAASGCVLPLEKFLQQADLADLAWRSPGRSHQSYYHQGHQWALAIDAACQTSAWRPDLLGKPPTTWDEILELAAEGRVLWPLGPVDAVASLLSLAAMAGCPCGAQPGQVVERGTALWALSLMSAVVQRSERRCLTDNPVSALEALTCAERFAYSPLVFCYAQYMRPGDGAKVIRFGDPPATGAGPRSPGPVLGGAGLAVSAYSDHAEEAAQYTLYVAGAPTQTGTYFDSGGQPAHGKAWSDPDLDRKSGGFFSATAPVMAKSWTRPRHSGFARFQDRMFELFRSWYPAFTEDGPGFLDRLDHEYRSCAHEAE